MRAIAAWALYAIGDGIWRICDQWLDLFREYGAGQMLFQAYQKSMDTSWRLQGAGDGPWNREAE